jgi:TonB family protein
MRRAIPAILFSSLTLAAAASPAQQLNDAPASTSLAISTGVTSPHLIYTTRIPIPADEMPSAPGSSTKVVLKVNLDEGGNPAAIQVLHSAGPAIDSRVVSAVRQFRWTPAVLNNKTVADEVTLTVDLQR